MSLATAPTVAFLVNPPAEKPPRNDLPGGTPPADKKD